MEGGHNGRRSREWINEGVSFVLRCLEIKYTNLNVFENRNLQDSGAHFQSFNDLMLNKRQEDELGSILVGAGSTYLSEETAEESVIDE